MTRKPIELSHLEGHLNSLIAPRGGEDEERGYTDLNYPTPLVRESSQFGCPTVTPLGFNRHCLLSSERGASQYPSSFPRSSVLHPMTRKPIELSHLEGHLNSLIAPRGGEDEERGYTGASFAEVFLVEKHDA
ncbi:hypothetical protein DPX16_22685 [Anabarilius grahami]|uniref:Uncharacterized protein n=1 Tax=Anabarilius grahami TaxID=495550 RepID=A0A3N0Z191_ANAGA|nr:hypothetical protein DPX16_22685 [Anabarilius grahami]